MWQDPSTPASPRYPYAEPGLPLGVDDALSRPDHIHRLLAGDTVLMFTDGLVEHPRRCLDACLDAPAAIASAHSGLPLDALCRVLADRHPRSGQGRRPVVVLGGADAFGDVRSLSGGVPAPLYRSAPLPGVRRPG
ncbi:SpoIIE family protein phosphatase [Streptomyces sp. NPDC058632]|uniref:SpoIIE family protein phosphatase n=1 Tax=Streptomyces sp. NPDC058632 TaxID=3346567 RepID=UPI0036557CF4